ncbi:winged helix-turn-helix transcriptional regulator [Sulfurisphaera ohwakuensis]|uniref:HTH domain-containing protein n=1 Tax=Sulfurisphaera ohwakuensis TaxID=69656 RepID=A0A650CJR6_SULOH|nr:HTH domain-containing protein [Sulfurisphaera ohwakuensis]MBB5253900.1 Mn-dependent DtxR family transcriptional regulator [Sulfurisphaera ohwakuensis]QGR17963.1 HTH domain-containing protein [Sulfurisphaera ohwakuensis]
MELTPRLQDIISILKEKKEINIKDLALELKISPKTAKGYARELYRLGFVELDNDNIKLKNSQPVSSDELKKILDAHEAEITNLKKEIELLKEELAKIKKSRSKS